MRWGNCWCVMSSKAFSRYQGWFLSQPFSTSVGFRWCQIPPRDVPWEDQPWDGQKHHTVTNGEPLPPGGSGSSGSGQGQSWAVLQRRHSGKEGNSYCTWYTVAYFVDDVLPVLLCLWCDFFPGDVHLDTWWCRFCWTRSCVWNFSLKWAPLLHHTWYNPCGGQQPGTGEIGVTLTCDLAPLLLTRMHIL